MREFAWSCDRGCDGGLRVSIGTTITGPVVAPNGTLAIRLPGKDVEALRAAWQVADADATFTPTTVGGQAAVIAGRRYESATLLFVHRAYVIAITAWGTLGLDPAAGFALEQFLAGLTLLGAG
jgi:hypothetical protein